MLTEKKELLTNMVVLDTTPSTFIGMDGLDLDLAYTQIAKIPKPR